MKSKMDPIGKQVTFERASSLAGIVTVDGKEYPTRSLTNTPQGEYVQWYMKNNAAQWYMNNNAIYGYFVNGKRHGRFTIVSHTTKTQIYYENGIKVEKYVPPKRKIEY